MLRYKRLSKSRTVTIPKDLAAESGFFPGMSVDLIASAEEIIIKKHVPSCIYCGSTVCVKKLRGKEICEKCAEQIKKEMEKIYG